jgi:hypothetical protein
VRIREGQQTCRRLIVRPNTRPALSCTVRTERRCRRESVRRFLAPARRQRVQDQRHVVEVSSTGVLAQRLLDCLKLTSCLCGPSQGERYITTSAGRPRRSSLRGVAHVTRPEILPESAQIDFLEGCPTNRPPCAVEAVVKVTMPRCLAAC